MTNNHFGVINPNDWVGLTLEIAQEKAANLGYTTRITEMNGNPLIVTMDLRNNRINFRVNGNVVSDAYPG
jgi:hypothetical protein